jgi:WD40 repeat protein
VSWNSYIKSHLITSDYDGAIQLWDVASGSTMELSQFEDHARRVWSIDFSRLDPLQFASASDDATVRIWNLQQQTPTACIKTPANACSVHNSPHRATMLAVACANHYCYLYDTRMAGSPLATLCGANRAVSYVRFMDANTIIGASTDNTVRLWDISRESFEEKDKALGASEEFTGHLNERNFVGLSVHPDGYIATGSEDNSVCCYYRAFPFALTKFNCSSAVQEDASNARGKPASQQQQQQPKTFVSSVCWARHSRHLLVGNSEGVLKVLQLKELSESRNEKNSQ